MGIVLYNTLSKKKEAFVPLNPQKIGLYVCGPTVYDFAHIGNARPFTIFDVLTRLLRHTYPSVCYVRNITDVDDKINAAALERNEPIAHITQETTAAFHQDMASLGNLPPDVEPRATHHIPEMIGMIQTLMEKGYAYEANGHVLFSVTSFNDYGRLSRRNQEEMLAGARVEVAPYKKNPGDFILWKPSQGDTPGWESPWGLGRPGWHIECSAMSSRYLGPVFDIHGGGQDLIFPHHENEIAQSRCAHGAPVFARYWMHNGYLTLKGDKMSKSLGNFFIIRDLLTRHSGEAIRFALLSTHYRQPMDWTANILSQAKQNLDRLYTALRGCQNLPERGEIDPLLQSALEDDLNTPLAISRLHDLATTLNKATDEADRTRLGQVLKTSGQMMGLLQHDPDAWFQGDVTANMTPFHIEAQIQARQEARNRKDFAESDRIRQALLQGGIILEDSATGTTWRRGP